MAAVRGDLVRSAEWHRVRDFAQEVRASPAALAIQGEAGAGKSTLWRAGTEVATAAGHRLLRSEPSASEADMSFAGLSDLLAEVLPRVAGQIPAPQREALEVALLLRPAGAEPPTARAVGLAVLAALSACASEGPVLAAIDDVQWLDTASLEALTFALRRASSGPLSLMVAARTEATADPLTAGAPPPSRDWRNLLDALPSGEMIDLAPLDMRQIQNLLPAHVTAARARLVAQQSRGNPFWAKEILASLDSEGPVPPLARTLTSRLSRSLSPEAAEALAVVAAAGRIGMADALEVLDHLADPAAALDAAVLAGVVIETGDRLSAAHPLIGSAAVESLPPGRRLQFYRRLAEAASGPERYAYFAALAAGGQGPEPAVADALDTAAAAAYARAANAAAGQFAVQAVQFTPAPDATGLVRRRIRAGELLFLAGDLAGSLGQLEELDLGQLATADLERVLPLLLDMTEILHGAAAATAIVTRAVGEAGTDPRRRALVLASASDVIYGVRGGKRTAAQEAIRCAEAAGPPAAGALHRALVNLFMAKAVAAEGLEVGLLDRAAALEAGLPSRRIHDGADIHRAWARYTEDLNTARTALRRSIAQAREAGDDFAQAVFLSYLATTEALAGDYPAATAAADTAKAVADWYDWPSSPWIVEPRCELLIAAGDLDSAARLADEQLPDHAGAAITTRFMGACLRGKVSAWRGDHPATMRHLELAVWCAEQCDWADPGVRCYLDPLLAEAYVATGRADEARRISAWLREVGERLDRPALTGDAARIDALAAAAAGDLDAAADLVRAAVAAHRSAPLRPELARSLLVLGQVERRRKARRQSRQALSRAYELAAEMGHRPLLDQIRQEMPRVAAKRSGAELTATERRVADLIAGGATNRDAAAALFVSVRTVETHVAAIYRKLGVRTRAELARRLPGSQ